MTPDQVLEAVRLTERSRREARKLPLDHVLAFAEFPFAFAHDAVKDLDRVSAAVYQSHPQMGLFRAMALLARKDYAGANSVLESLQRLTPGEPKASMRFGVPIPQAAATLPEVHGEYPTGNALFLCCDYDYFRAYGVVLLTSILANSPDTHVHLHLIDADVPFISDTLSRSRLRFSITHESGNRGHDYYGAIRLIRFAEALERSAGKLLMSDVDALVMGDLRDLWKVKSPIAMRVRPGRLEPWNQFSACLIMGSKNALPYFRAVSNIIKASIDAPWWGIDQYALFSAWTTLKPHIHLFGPEIAAVDSETPGQFWFTAGKIKAKLATLDTKYAEAFRKFAALV